MHRTGPGRGREETPARPRNEPAELDRHTCSRGVEKRCCSSFHECLRDPASSAGLPVYEKVGRDVSSGCSSGSWGRAISLFHHLTGPATHRATQIRHAISQLLHWTENRGVQAIGVEDLNFVTEKTRETSATNTVRVRAVPGRGIRCHSWTLFKNGVLDYREGRVLELQDRGATQFPSSAYRVRLQGRRHHGRPRARFVLPR